ncbi:MAG: glucosidase [Proteobacteria bacterium]|nr:glucosidase [Pseudomonadota bacterium]
MIKYTPEQLRLQKAATREEDWHRWGPYLAERQWGTVREDYSRGGDAWEHFPHEHARTRAYRWGDDGLLGLTDRRCRLCFAVALWNKKDPILKERLFGLTNPEGNHGEDAKEQWYYLDSTPTHSYMRGLYKYPQQAFPYEQLIRENARRGKLDPEYELHDTGIFEGDRYFDVFVEYAKDGPEDLLIRFTIENRGPDAAPLTLLPKLWFRNTWSWGDTHGSTERKPRLSKLDARTVLAEHETLGRFLFRIEEDAPLLFTENETNAEALYGVSNAGGLVKDGLHRAIIWEQTSAVRDDVGTKLGVHFELQIPARGNAVVRLRLTRESEDLGAAVAFDNFDAVLQKRREEADAFYDALISPRLTEDQISVARQAYAGLLWSKQFYHFVVPSWVQGDPNQPAPPAGRGDVRNGDWQHFHASDILSMPDKWEYPWFAAWDLAFHMIPMAKVDPEFAKGQLELILREWYMHPSGQIPAYEWNFGDVNPPVHAWACWRVYKMSGTKLKRDLGFLERCFQKLLVNFTWWVNRKDVDGRHIFAGGFLGLDNIGLFDRSKPLPCGHSLAQADGTAWMAFYCGSMLSMALELAQERPAYENIASKFFEHFIQIVDAMNALGSDGLWDERDGFYYDQLLIEKHGSTPMRTRSVVGVIPLLAVEVLDQRVIDRLPGFKSRMEWFLKNRPDLGRHVSCMTEQMGDDARMLRLLSVPSRDRLQRVLRYILDEDEFLSTYGIRSLSRVHAREPYGISLNGTYYSISYEPGESQSGLFGGNSNWRGPIWFPINYLLVEALERYHHFYGDSFTVELPTRSGNWVNLRQVSHELARRLSSIFTLDENGLRPCLGESHPHAHDPHWRDHVQFHEYFHGDHGQGLGASHQTGWTSLVTRCLGVLGRDESDK